MEIEKWAVPSRPTRREGTLQRNCLDHCVDQIYQRGILQCSSPRKLAPANSKEMQKIDDRGHLCNGKNNILRQTTIFWQDIHYKLPTQLESSNPSIRSPKECGKLGIRANNHNKTSCTSGAVLIESVKKHVQSDQSVGDVKKTSCFMSLCELQKTIKLDPQKPRKKQINRSKRRKNTHKRVTSAEYFQKHAKADPTPDLLIEGSEHHGSIAKMKFLMKNRSRGSSSPIIRLRKPEVNSRHFLKVCSFRNSKNNRKKSKGKSVSFKVPSVYFAQDAKQTFPKVIAMYKVSI